MQSIFTRKRNIIVLITPALTLLCFALLAPIFVSVYYSFTDWSGLGPYGYIGTDHYRTILFHDPVFWKSLKNAMLYLLVTVCIQHPFAFTVAVALSKLREKTSQIFRTVFFIPAILTVVVTTKLWIYIYNPNFGLLHNLFNGLGWDRLAKTAWLSDPATALGAIILMMIWQGFGWALLLYYSALMAMPKELLDAGSVDGVSGLKLYRYIVIPYLLPVINSILIIAVAATLKTMETVFLATGGGPGDITQFLANYLYQKAFVSNQFGYANAISVLFVIIAMSLALATNQISGRSNTE